MADVQIAVVNKKDASVVVAVPGLQGPAGPQGPVGPGTDLSYTASTRLLESSTGGDVTLPLFSTSSTDAGLVPGSSTGGTTNFLRADGTWAAPPSGGAGTDLSYDAGTRLLSSSTGSDVTLPLATTSNAGLLGSSDKTKLDGIASGAEVNVSADWNASSGDAQILNKPTLGTAAALNVGTGANNVVQLDGSGKLPAVDGSQLTNLPSGSEGADGREVELQAGATHIQWRYVGETVWVDLVALSVITGPAGSNGADGAPGATGADGDDGREVELQTSATHIQWRYVGDSSWANLVALSAITGPAGADGADGAAGAAGAAGVDGDDGREVELQKSSTHVQWRYVGDTTWINLIALSEITGSGLALQGSVATVGDLPASSTVGYGYIVEATGDLHVWNGSVWVNAGPIQGPAGADGAAGAAGADGDDGREIELQVSATHIQWRYVGDSTWTDLVALSAITGPAGSDGADGAPGAAGTDGREVELQVSATHIQWRYVGDTTWLDLVALSTITGPAGADGADGAPGTDGADGQNIELQTNATHVQWRVVGASTWTDLIALSAITGPQGATGATGSQGPAGQGVPTGGTTGQFLRKSSGTDYDAAFADLPARSTSAAGIVPATSFAAITYAATVDLDMASLNGQYRTISLTGNLEFTTSNRATGRTVVLRLVADGTQRTLTFPAGWVFVGTKPANIAASKSAILSLSFFGTADTDCIAAWGVQS